MKNSLKEVGEKIKKKLEDINIFLKENKETVIKQMKEMIRDLKMEIEAIKKKHKPKELWKWKVWVSNQEPQMQA